MKKHQQLGARARSHVQHGARDGSLVPDTMRRPYASKSEGTAVEAWTLPKGSKKRRQRPGSQGRFGAMPAQMHTQSTEYKQLEMQPNPVLKRDRIIRVKGNTGMVEVDKSKKWMPKGNIPKGF